MRMLILSFLLVACGESTQEGLEGTWISPLNDVCVVGFTFSSDGLYNYVLVCPLVDGRYGYEVVFGYYRASESEIHFTSLSGSCAGNGDVDATYRFAEGQLRLIFDHAAYLLSKQGETVENEGEGPRYVLGCFTQGRFTPGPLHDVQ